MEKSTRTTTIISGTAAACSAPCRKFSAAQTVKKLRATLKLNAEKCVAANKNKKNNNKAYAIKIYAYKIYHATACCMPHATPSHH